MGTSIENNYMEAFGSRHSTAEIKHDTAVSRASTSFIKNYKNINFDTLKERHDNFSFGKAIEVKHQVYDTLHFQDLNPNSTNMVLLQKTAQPKVD
jgi:hypothetical protein